MILLLKALSLVLALIVLLRIKVNLSLAVLILTMYTIVIFQVNLKNGLMASGNILIDKNTIHLYIIIVMVLYIAAVQKAKNMFDKLVSSLNSIFKDKRIVAMITPAIIGFLPMPGGALVSAPLVDVSLKNTNIKPEFKTFMNYWFRHVWEYIWPIYAGLLIFQAMSKIPLKQIILFQSPFTILNIMAGIIITLIYFKKNPVPNNYLTPAEKTGALRNFIEGIWPILLAIILFFFIGLPLYLALVSVSAILTLLKRLSIKEIAGFLFSTFILKTLVLIGSVMIFQEVIRVSRAFEPLKTMDVSVEIVVLFAFFVSFTMGFLTGVNTAFIVLAFPILLPMIEHLPNYFYLSLYIYIIGFAGILLSPIHLCLVLSNEYFKAPLYKVYKYMLPPVLIQCLLATVLVLVL